MKKRFGALFLVLSSLVLSAACASSRTATEPKPQPQKEQPQSQETWEGVELSAAPSAAAAVESEVRR